MNTFLYNVEVLNPTAGPWARRWVTVEASSPSGVSQAWIDGVSEFQPIADGERLGAIQLCEGTNVPAHYADPSTLWEHLVCWHLDTDGADIDEAVEDAEDKAKRLLALLGRFRGVTLHQEARITG